MADAYTPGPAEENKPYCYPTQVENELMCCAYAFGMTEEQRYAEKLAAFFRSFCPVYLEREKGCSQSYVQEGHFFQHLAICYDMIREAGVLTEAEKQAVSDCFYLYMTIQDRHLYQGHMSNWLISEMVGALYCAIALDDFAMIDRFAFGCGGLQDQIAYGMFNDGWWYECSVSYNTWVSSMLLHVAHVLRRYGIDWVHHAFPASYSRQVDACVPGEKPALRFDMDNERRGGFHRNCIYIKDIFDAPLPYLDTRGVIFGVCDSYERILTGEHFGSTYELAYHYYRDPQYIPVIRRMQMQDCIFGIEDLPEGDIRPVQNAHSDNLGIAMLRSAAPGRPAPEQLQAVLRYGSHGYAHGHFDIASLLSVMRYGRSFFNPEHVWWGYPHFMYKFYVQNSMSKNMVVVDEKHQNVADSRCTLFAAGKHIQAACIETEVTWSYPPYGGMVYDEAESLEQRCAMNGCTLDQPADAPAFGTTTGFTEPILTRRLMAVCDDYLVLFDELKGTRPHRFSNLFQIKGFEGLTGNAVSSGHTRRFSDDPLTDAQFVTDCTHYEAAGTTCAHFTTVFGPGEDLRGTRAYYNEPGLLKMDIHTAWPPQNHQIVGLTAEDHLMYIPVEYAVRTEKQCCQTGSFGSWLGCERVLHADLSDASRLTIDLFCPPLYTEQKDPYSSKQGLFLGNARLTLRNGETKPLSTLPMERVNIDEGFGIGRDYENGRVLLCGEEMPDAIPVSPADHAAHATLTVDLTGLNAVSFDAELGTDAFPGEEQQRRRTYAIQTSGSEARFITVVEPFERDAMVRSVSADTEDTVHVTLTDGQVQTLQVRWGETPSISFSDGNGTETLTGITD